MKLPFKLVYILALGLSLSNCKKEPAIEKETITVHDTIFISTIDTLYIPDDSDATNFIFVRHAEKEDFGTDPDLCAKGIKRAERLAYILAENELNRV